MPSPLTDRIIGTPPCVFEKDSNNPVDRLNIAADNHLARREYLQAQHCAEEAIQQAERIEQKKKGCSFIRLAEVHRAQGKHQHAVETYLKAAESFEMQGDDRGRIITLSYIIELHRDHKEWEQVIEYCHKAMELAHQHEELSNGDGQFKEAQEYLDWQERFKQVLEYALTQYDATTPLAPPSKPSPLTTQQLNDLTMRLTNLEKEVKNESGQMSQRLDKLGAHIHDVEKHSGDQVEAIAQRLTKLEEQGKSNIAQVSQQLDKLEARVQGLETLTGSEAQSISEQLAALEKQVKNNSAQVAQQLGRLEAHVRDVENQNSHRVEATTRQLADLEKQAKSDTAVLAQQLYKLGAYVQSHNNQTDIKIEAFARRLTDLEQQVGNDSTRTLMRLDKLGIQIDSQAALIAKLAGTPKSQPKPAWQSTPHRYPLRHIPVYDPLSAGKARPASDDIVSYIETEQLNIDGQPLELVPLKGKQITFAPEYEYAAMQVVGDSMDEAGILANDYVILQRSKLVELKPDHEDIVAVVFRDEDTKATLKRILIEEDQITLKPESSNPEHKPRILQPAELLGTSPYVNIVGIAVAVLKPVDADKEPQETSSSEKVLARIHMNRDIELFRESEQHEFIQSLARHLGVSKQDIEVIYVTAGSVLMTIEVSEEIALKLQELQLKRDPVMKELRIINVDYLLAIPPSIDMLQLSPPTSYRTSIKTDNEKSEQNYPGKLRRILDTYFNETELRNLCLDINVDYDSLSSGGKADKARELVRYCDRHGCIPDLVNAINKDRPNAPWRTSIT